MTAAGGKRKFGRARPTADGGLRRATAGEARHVEVRARFSPSLIALVDKEAEGLGMARRQWIVALVRRRLTGRPCLPRQEQLALFRMHTELRRTRTELMMIRRELLERGHEPSLSDFLGAIDRQAAALEMAMSAVRDALKGDLAYWSPNP